MFGHVETLAERIEHLERCAACRTRRADLPPSSPGPFSPAIRHWPICRKAGALRLSENAGRQPAVSRQFPNIQASWVTQGLRVGQLALRFGANDMGSLMIEENVVAAAGTRFRTTEQEIRRAIAAAGYRPAGREMCSMSYR